MRELLPALSPPFPACFLFLQVPQPLPHSLSSLPLGPSWSERLLTIQTKRHQPPADRHQHLLFLVTFSPFIKNMICPSSSQSPHRLAIFWLTFALNPLPDLTQHPCNPASPILFSPFPAAKISCSPLPHPQRAYKLRVSNLFMDSLSVLQQYYFHILNKS